MVAFVLAIATPAISADIERTSIYGWRDDAGADYQPHAHDHAESLWVIRGEITFGIGDKHYTLFAGDRLAR